MYPGHVLHSSQSVHHPHPQHMAYLLDNEEDPDPREDDDEEREEESSRKEIHVVRIV